MKAAAALPLSQQIVVDLLVPPIGAALWWLLSRGWATVVQGVNISDQTKRRQKTEFLLLVVAAYILMFGITLYGYFTVR